jgi:hypothetical protein
MLPRAAEILIIGAVIDYATYATLIRLAPYFAIEPPRHIALSPADIAATPPLRLAPPADIYVHYYAEITPHADDIDYAAVAAIADAMHAIAFAFAAAGTLTPCRCCRRH